MPKATHTPSSLRRRKKVMKLAKGSVGGRRRLHRTALENLRRGMVYAYRDRKAKKRNWRSLWILRLSSASRQHGLTYSRLIQGLKKAGVGLDRKSLAEIAVNDAAGFAELVKVAREGLVGKAA